MRQAKLGCYFIGTSIAHTHTQKDTVCGAVNDVQMYLPRAISNHSRKFDSMLPNNKHK